MNPAFSSLLAALARELDLPGIETRDDDPSWASMTSRSACAASLRTRS